MPAGDCGLGWVAVVADDDAVVVLQDELLDGVERGGPRKRLDGGTE